MKDKIIKTCLGIDCPERFSLCCHAGSRSATEPEMLLGVPAYFCAKCGKEFEGGKCTAGEKELPNIIELTERIVIDFANLTGRETESRAEFRALVYKHLEDFIGDFEKRLEEYRNSPDVWKNVGVSKWRNWGIANGYFQFFNMVDKQELKEKIVALRKIHTSEVEGCTHCSFNDAIEEVLKLLT